MATKSPIGIFFYSLIQNLLSNALSLNNLYTSINANMEINNRTGIAFDLGRLVRVLTIYPLFEPESASNSVAGNPDLRLERNSTAV